jgi:DMSO/TMAO reductase YedYZ molybdopterin-dependent catalytic subunit
MSRTKAYASDPNLKISIEGAVQNPTTVTVTDLMAMPRTEIQAELTCYGLPLANCRWAGVKLWTLIEQAGIIKPEIEIAFGAADGYSIPGFPMAEAQRDDVIIAYELDGIALPETVRLVVPGANGNVWIALINRITVSQSSYQMSPVLPQTSPVPFRGGGLPETSSAAQVYLPKLNETVKQPPANETSVVPQQPAVEQPAQPTEQPPLVEQQTTKSTTPIDYTQIVIVVASALLASAVAGTLYVKKRKRTRQ